MKIHNVRFGHACNSSSTHSMVYLDGRSCSDDFEPGAFGWDYFTVASSEGKDQYVGAVLHHAMTECLGVEHQDHATRLASLWMQSQLDGSASVDHQSMPQLPRNWGETLPHRKFFERYRAHVLQPDIAILGGNDNDNREHQLASGAKDAGVPLAFDSTAAPVCREDLGYWAIFNRNTGDKMRMSFERDAAAPTHATRPELVDIKITDWCDKGCAFCYQGSTVKGHSADPHYLWELIPVLAKMNVFEVAIGGGEPTAYAEFWEFCRDLREAGVVPNFTTRSTAWMEDVAARAVFDRDIGEVAFSVDDAKSLEDMLIVSNRAGIKWSRYWSPRSRRASVQVVIGVVANKELSKIADLCSEHGMRLTLLGFKPNGRGALYAGRHPSPKVATNWLQHALFRDVETDEPSARRYIDIAVDTAFVRQFEQQLRDAKICEQYYTAREGDFSCYVDATQRTVGPSSYCESLLMRPLQPSEMSEMWRLSKVESTR